VPLSRLSVASQSLSSASQSLSRASQSPLSSASQSIPPWVHGREAWEATMSYQGPVEASCQEFRQHLMT